MEWYQLLDNRHFLSWKELESLFYFRFYPLHDIHQDRNSIYNFWPRTGESLAQAWGRLKLLMRKCPNHEFSKETIIINFYARFSQHDKELLDASSKGSFMNQKIDIKWNLIERIQRNAED